MAIKQKSSDLSKFRLIDTRPKNLAQQPTPTPIIPDQKDQTIEKYSPAKINTSPQEDLILAKYNTLQQQKENYKNSEDLILKKYQNVNLNTPSQPDNLMTKYNPVNIISTSQTDIL